MKHFLLVLFLAAATAVSAGATVISFEDLSGQGAMPSGYAGLSWSNGWDYYDWAQDPYSPSSGIVRAYNNQGTPPPRFSFAGLVVFNGAYFSGREAAGYDLYLSGSLVASSAVIQLSNVPTWLASGYAGLVDEVRLTGVSQGSFVIDDITYDARGRVDAVPEPGTYALLAAGLGALALLRRRR